LSAVLEELIVIEKALVTVVLTLSFTWIVGVVVWDVVGVPDSIPVLEASDKPVGRVPALTVHV